MPIIVHIMPGGITCSVMSCKNNSTTARKMGKPLGFFTFPKDFNVRKEWVNRCNRKENWNPGSNSSRICSDHFQISDFEDLVKARMLNVNPKRLKSDGKCLGIRISFLLWRLKPCQQCQHLQINQNHPSLLFRQKDKTPKSAKVRLAFFRFRNNRNATCHEGALITAF